MRTFFLAAIFLFAAALSTKAQPPSPTILTAQTAARESTPALRRKTFQKAWETVRDNKTEGDDMDADLVKLPTGAYLIYAAGQPRTPKGVVVGRGVIPDLEVNLTRAGLLRGEDAQLDAALQYIQTKGGDILTAIDGRPARSFTLDEIRATFRRRGREHLLTFRRGTKTERVKMKSRRMARAGSSVR
jgi:C-terminal processing protease CtpA/Prc